MRLSEADLHLLNDALSTEVRNVYNILVGKAQKNEPLGKLDACDRKLFKVYLRET